jgi:ATP-dependent Lhr-like helicase
MSYALARAHHDVLAGPTTEGVTMSKRAVAALDGLRDEHEFVAAGSRDLTYVVRGDAHGPVWWTFGGFAANSALATGLPEMVDQDASVGDLRVRLRPDIDGTVLRAQLTARCDELAALRPEVADDAVTGLKFSAALPIELARSTVAERLTDPLGVDGVVRASIRQHSG